MVGPLLLLKMLHCKQMIKKKKKKKKKKSSKAARETYNSSSDNDERTEHQEEENSCRVCLNVGNIPIYGNDLVDDLSDALKTFGGVELETDDTFPKFLCATCYTQLQTAITFRNNAQKTDKLLRNREEVVEPICLISSPINDRGSSPFNDDPSCIDDDNSVASLEIDEDAFLNKRIKEKKARKWLCRRCKLEFKGFEDYQSHRLSDEHENFRQTCPVCNKSFMHSSFRNHLKLHRQDKPYMCDYCGKEFRMQGQMSRHRATHIDELPYKCPMCPYRGRFNECVKMHMRTHTGEKPYQCVECPAKFVNKGNLTRHLLIHKEDRDFKCDACDRGFYTRRELELHLKVDHTGVKDHVCNICGKAFGYRRQMLKHQLKVHKREKLRGGRVPVYLILETEKQRREMSENQNMM